MVQNTNRGLTKLKNAMNLYSEINCPVEILSFFLRHAGLHPTSSIQK